MDYPLTTTDRVTTVRRSAISGSFVLVHLNVKTLDNVGFDAEAKDLTERFSWGEFNHTVHKYDPEKPDKEGYWWATSKTFKSRIIIEIVFDYRGVMVWVMGKQYKCSWARFNRSFVVTNLEYIDQSPTHYWDYL